MLSRPWERSSKGIGFGYETIKLAHALFIEIAATEHLAVGAVVDDVEPAYEDLVASLRGGGAAGAGHGLQQCHMEALKLGRELKECPCLIVATARQDGGRLG